MAKLRLAVVSLAILFAIFLALDVIAFGVTIGLGKPLSFSSKSYNIALYYYDIIPLVSNDVEFQLFCLSVEGTSTIALLWYHTYMPHSNQHRYSHQAHCSL